MDLDVKDKVLTEKMLKKFHKKKLKVNCWTVDDIDTLRQLEAMGVDYITSNVFDQNA